MAWLFVPVTHRLRFKIDFDFAAADECPQCRPIGNGSLFEHPGFGFMHMRIDQAPTRCHATHLWQQWKREEAKAVTR